ncbi:hypothetical protein ACWJJH_03140 [Endozoicomonadaceae bacterium StTr2]
MIKYLIKAILKTIRWLCLYIAMPITIISGVANLYEYISRPQLLADELNISEAPNSLSIEECEFAITTDVLYDCVIKIDSEEFSLLLKGYEFNKTDTNTSSHSFGIFEIPPEFKVTEHYIVWPEKYKQGGLISIVTNKNHDIAKIHVYIE